MSFKDKGFQTRFEQMGDQAEAVFEHVATEVLKRGFVRYGLDRPPLRMSQLPARVRYSPDYLMSTKFVEVQGFGRDQTMKLKLDKWNCLHFWNSVHPVDLFVYDSHNERWAFVALHQLDALLADGRATLDSFPEGKTYFAFPADSLMPFNALAA